MTFLNNFVKMPFKAAFGLWFETDRSLEFSEWLFLNRIEVFFDD